MQWETKFLELLLQSFLFTPFTLEFGLFIFLYVLGLVGGPKEQNLMYYFLSSSWQSSYLLKKIKNNKMMEATSAILS